MGRRSDVRSLELNFDATRDAFRIDTQLYYNFLKGKGADDGQDTKAYGLFLKSGYRALTQQENGVNLEFYGFLEIARIDYGDLGTQTRYIPGAGCILSGATPVGGFLLSYLFSHDRNDDGDIEVTGDKYFNFSTVSLGYILPLTDALLFSTGLDYMLVMNMPDDMEDNSTDFNAGLGYSGWKNYYIYLNYVNSLSGYKNQGVNLSIGYRW